MSPRLIRDLTDELIVCTCGPAESTLTMWIDQLRDKEGTTQIVTQLEELKTALAAGEGQVDGARVGELLSGLADETRTLSARTPGLETLSAALASGAERLRTGEE